MADRNRNSGQAWCPERRAESDYYFRPEVRSWPMIARPETLHKDFVTVFYDELKWPAASRPGYFGRGFVATLIRCH